MASQKAIYSAAAIFFCRKEFTIIDPCVFTLDKGSSPNPPFGKGGIGGFIFSNDGKSPSIPLYEKGDLLDFAFIF